MEQQKYEENHQKKFEPLEIRKEVYWQIVNIAGMLGTSVEHVIEQTMMNHLESIHRDYIPDIE